MKRISTVLFLSFALTAGLGFSNPAFGSGASKTFSGFAAKKYSLSQIQKRSIAEFVSSTDVETATCTGYFAIKATNAEKGLALKRAQTVCAYVSNVLGGVENVASATSTKSKTLLNAVGIKYTKADPKKASPFETPFPTEFTKEQVIEAAIANFAKYSRKTDPKSTVKLTFQSTFPKSEIAWVTKMANLANEFLPYPDKYESLAIFGSSDEFIISELTKAGLPVPAGGLCNRKTTFESFCANGGYAVFNFMDSIQRGGPITESGRRSVIAHELFHVWQKTVDGSPPNNNLNPDFPTGLPIWFAEGNANFFGFALTHNAGETDYFDGRYRQVDAYMNSNSKSLREHVNWQNNAYGIGQASAEYLVASVGFEKLLNIYLLVGQGSTFAAAFEQSIGISLDSYYQKFDQVQKNFTR